MDLGVDHLAHQRQHLSRTSQSNRQRQPLVRSAQLKRPPEHPLHQLQRAIGNRAVGRFIQAELRVSQPGEAYEQEADGVAEQVMRMPDSLPAISSNGSPVSIHRKCAACASGGSLCPECAAEEQVQRQSLAVTFVPVIQRKLDDEEETLQSKEISGGLPELTPDTEARIEALQGSGQPLPQPIRAFFEPRFGRDFSHVRIHTDAHATESARPLNTQAYTLGHDIVLGAGEYARHSSDGRRLLAHELAHVIQQTPGRMAAPRSARAVALGPQEGRQGGFDHAQLQAMHMSKANDAEGQVKKAATYALPMRATVGLSPLSTPAVQRQPKPQLTRAEEVRLSFTSPGEIAVVPNPPAISLYNFAIDRAVLKEKHVAALQVLASLINQFAGGKLSIDVKGHADSSGEDTINDPLSKNRALSVQKVLASAAGMSTGA
jgi:outer membrane protein OmpA-like peptidoglycan-associated protein